MGAAVGMLSQMGIDSANPVTKRFDFQSENLTMKEKLVDGNGLRGTLSSDISRVRPSTQVIDGPISFEPNVWEMDELLEWILGGTPSGSGTVTYPVADTALTRYVTIDRKAKVFTYAGVGVDQATFRGSQGSTLSLDLMCVAKTETVANEGTFPSLSINTASGPWIFEELTLVINSVTVQAKMFEMTINNRIDRQRFFNSLTLTDVVKHDREVMFSTSVPYYDYLALYAAGEGGVTVTATFTNGSNVLAFSLVAVAFPRIGPNVPGRQEIMLPIRGQAFASGATKEIVTTIAS